MPDLYSVFCYHCQCKKDNLVLTYILHTEVFVLQGKNDLQYIVVKDSDVLASMA